MKGMGREEGGGGGGAWGLPVIRQVVFQQHR